MVLPGDGLRSVCSSTALKFHSLFLYFEVGSTDTVLFRHLVGNRPNFPIQFKNSLWSGMYELTDGQTASLCNMAPCCVVHVISLIMPPPLIFGGIKRCFCLTSVRLSRTSGLSREQSGLGRLKLAQRYPTSHVTQTPFSRSKGQGHQAALLSAALTRKAAAAVSVET